MQGVGFRWNAKDSVSGLHITGYVKNLSDGSVELLLEGELRNIIEAQAAVDRRMRGYWISRNHEDLGGEAHWDNFSIHS